jgi:ubiquinone/menaquinone biosynthesis C-methylase UbiE
MGGHQKRCGRNSIGEGICFRSGFRILSFALNLICARRQHLCDGRGENVSDQQDSAFRRVLKNLSHKSRTKKFELLKQVFSARPQDRVLDVGASGEVFLQYSLEDVYPYPKRIVAGGYEASEVIAARRHYPDPQYVQVDGCSLPFPDKSFDLVFSNAVIEHILGPSRQEQFAKEVMRVGKSWFVTTPNYWYPFETHHHLPFFQFLPRPIQMEYNRLLGTHIPKGTVQELGLLSARQLQRLFPTSQIAKVRVTVWPETLVAYYIDRQRPAASP